MWSSTDQKEFKLHTVHSVVEEQKKSLQLVDQAALFKFEAKVEPLQLISQSLAKAVLEGNQRF